MLPCRTGWFTCPLALALFVGGERAEGGGGGDGAHACFMSVP